jgi:hypothetical protein
LRLPDLLQILLLGLLLGWLLLLRVLLLKLLRLGLLLRLLSISALQLLRLYGREQSRADGKACAQQQRARSFGHDSLLRSERHRADAIGRHEPEGLTGVSGKTRGPRSAAPGKARVAK